MPFECHRDQSIESEGGTLGVPLVTCYDCSDRSCGGGDSLCCCSSARRYNLAQGILVILDYRHAGVIN